jgi:N6-L-threonylcarbamoyladenine synthase
MLILGIESSCDDCSASIVENGRNILSVVVAGQEKYHRRFGGVVPEIAARKHLEHILPVIRHCLDQSGCTWTDINGIAVTHQPGLAGSLIVGLTAAKSLAFLHNKPLTGINHIEAHAYSACFAGMPYGTPHIALVASGGHTSLLHFDADKTMRLVGQTLDDAAGEAFDKVAKLLGFGYPGGPIIDQLAAKSQTTTIDFPRPMISSNNLDFSFSGLKTAIMYYKKHHPETPAHTIAASFQNAVIDVLVTKTLQAAKSFRLKTVSVVGGVAANSALRKSFEKAADKNTLGLFIPEPSLCTDNAAMVAGLGYHKLNNKIHSDLTLGISPHVSMNT